MSKKTEEPKIPTQAAIQKTLQARADEVASYEQDVKEFEIESQEDLEIMSDTLAKVKGLNNEFETQKRGVTDPLNGAIKNIRSWFSPMQDRLSKLETSIKAKMGIYILAQETKRKEALAEASVAVREKEGKRAVQQAMQKMQQAQVESVTDMSVRYTFEIEIVDMDALPDEWWSPDEGAIVRYVRMTKGEKEIPGVVITKVPIISQKAK